MLLLLLFVKATVLVALASLAAWFLRRGSASIRYAVLAAAIGALLVIPFATWSLPEWTTPRVPLPRVGNLEHLSTATPALDPRVLETIRSLSPLVGTAAVPGSPPVRDAIRPESRPWHLRPAVRFSITLAWALGALTLLSRLSVSLARLGMLTRRSRPAPDQVRVLGAQVATDAGLRRNLRIRLVPGLPVPITWGMIRPVVLLPADAVTWPACRMRGVLLHEIAHVIRWDWIGHLLTEVARAFYWPNPAVWHLARQAGLAQEEACDNMVLRHGYRGSSYATDLFDIARAALVARGGHGTAPPVGGLPFAEPSSLRQRIAAILSPVLPRDHLRGRAATLLLVTTTAIGLPVAAFEAPGWGRFDAFELALVDRAVQGEGATRVDAIRGLGATGFGRGLPVLVRAVTDADPGVRAGAVEALTLVRGGRVLGGIVASVEHPDPEVRAGSVRVIRTVMQGDLAPSRWHTLVRLLAHRAGYDRDPAIRGLALRSLAGLCDTFALDAILAGLEDGDPGVRVEALDAARGSQHLDARLRRAVVTSDAGATCGSLPTPHSPLVRAAESAPLA